MLKRKRLQLLQKNESEINLIPKAARVYSIASRIRKKQLNVSKTLTQYRRRLREAEKCSRDKVFLKVMSSVSESQKLFINMQERRFTVKEKVLALALYEQSGRCYILLQELFHLPSVRSLRQMQNEVRITAGWFEDYQSIRISKYTDHALVFMMRAVHSEWKFPIAYFMTENQASATYLIQCIRKITRRKTNVAAINKLKADTMINMADKMKYSNTIYLCGREICPLYDPPHSIKGIRNNLLNKDFEVDFKDKTDDERRFASWQIIQLACKMDINSNSIYRLMPKFTDEHIHKHKIKKMRVKYATQVFESIRGRFYRPPYKI